MAGGGLSKKNRPWRGRCRAGYSNTGGPPLPGKRAPCQKNMCCGPTFFLELALCLMFVHGLGWSPVVTACPSKLACYQRSRAPVPQMVIQDAPLQNLLARVRVGTGDWELVQ